MSNCSYIYTGCEHNTIGDSFTYYNYCCGFSDVQKCSRKINKEIQDMNEAIESMEETIKKIKKGE